MRPSTRLARMRDHVLATASAHGASGIRVFGSVAAGTDHEGSDIDLLVDVPAGTSLIKLVALQQALSDRLGVPVDLCTEAELHPALRERILTQAREL